MLKGVSRQVVEITQPENEYFERILLFVRPEYRDLSEARLAQHAKRALPGEARPPEEKKRRPHRLKDLLRAGLCAGAGAGMLALAEMLIGKAF